ncbi:Acyl-CoA N-acyltransferase [Moelleriella libera RCEF 2490]|uniref:Acyl-CoA N-acyltransferase n=1 Tax=Moelleriella libera RCEF 2490 TaxID=1081109 RepID=A0A168CNT3_9HYPO|nr:Acyl-CoA N-acyltransferase [Moelleriella libera RCEF 2490]
MPLRVARAGADDAARAVAIEHLAYGHGPQNSALFPGPFPPGGDTSRIETLKHQLREDPACHWAKVVDSDLEAQGGDGMIAFSMWYMWEKPRDTPPPTRKWGPGSNPEACELFFGGMRREWIRRFAHKPHVCQLFPWPSPLLPLPLLLPLLLLLPLPLLTERAAINAADLKLLHTDPQHQRRGAASSLLNWGIAEADRLGLPAYLESTPEGRVLYERHGWREVGRLVVDLSKWGGPADLTSTLMVRLPSTSA